MHLSILSPKIIFFVRVGRFKFQLLRFVFFSLQILGSNEQNQEKNTFVC